MLLLLVSIVQRGCDLRLAAINITIVAESADACELVSRTCHARDRLASVSRFQQPIAPKGAL